MNSVDNYYSAFFMTQIPGGPSIGAGYNNHGDGIKFSTPPLMLPRESPSSFLDEDISSQLLQQTQDIDRLVLYHAGMFRTELMDRCKQYWEQGLGVLEQRVSNRLKEKDEEIQRFTKMNLELEERIGLLRLDCQIWRELAQANAAAVTGLRSNLQEAIAAQERRCDAASLAEDADSCCGGDDNEHQCDTGGSRASRVCRNCREREAAVVLLPCRHLCLCSACGPAVNQCPVCRSSKTGSLFVNFD